MRSSQKLSIVCALTAMSFFLLVSAGMWMGNGPLAGTAFAEAPAAQPSATPAQAAQTTYTCSMHPEVTSDKPGKCPKCGMHLQAKAKAGAEPTKGASEGSGGDKAHPHHEEGGGHDHSKGH